MSSTHIQIPPVRLLRSYITITAVAAPTCSSHSDNAFETYVAGQEKSVYIIKTILPIRVFTILHTNIRQICLILLINKIQNIKEFQSKQIIPFFCGGINDVSKYPKLQGSLTFAHAHEGHRPIVSYTDFIALAPSRQTVCGRRRATTLLIR